MKVPGEIESEIDHAGGADKVLRKLFSYRHPGPLFLPKGQAFKDVPAYPDWLSKDEAAYYSDKFKETGFTGGLNYYRALDSNWELTAPWTGAKVNVPVKFVVGDLDLTYNTLGAKEYIHHDMKKDVPLLQDVVVLEGVAHFLQQEQPELITNHIYDFIRKF
ncbi:Epoxide hydrolase A [Bienertia sinuspersici]